MSNDLNCIREQILNQVRNVLENQDIQSTDNLIEAGINSRKAMDLLYQLKEAGFPVSLKLLLSIKSIDDLIEKLEDIEHTKRQQETELKEPLDSIRKVVYELAQEREGLTEDEELRRNNYLKEVETTKLIGPKSYQHILITGSTGFLGSHIAMELLKHTSYQLYLLVRGKSKEACEEKIKRIWTEYAMEDVYSAYKERVTIVQGDITATKLGMDVNQYNTLASTIDCIIHSAAIVSHVEPWEHYQKVNIDGTKAVLKFASYIKRKDINYISTIATEFTQERIRDSRLFYEEAIPDESTSILYVKSKIECEKLMESYRKKGFGIKIFRMGFLVHNYETGRFQTNADENAFIQVLTLMNRMKAFPVLTSQIIDLTYVDEAARAVTLLFDKQDNVGIYHIFNSSRISIKDIGSAVMEKDRNISMYSVDEFLKFLDDERSKYSLELEQLSIMMMTKSGVDLNAFALSKNEKTSKLLNEMKFQWHSFDQKAINDLYSIIKGKDE